MYDIVTGVTLGLTPCSKPEDGSILAIVLSLLLQVPPPGEDDNKLVPVPQTFTVPPVPEIRLGAFIVTEYVAIQFPAV